MDKAYANILGNMMDVIKGLAQNFFIANYRRLHMDSPDKETEVQYGKDEANKLMIDFRDQRFNFSSKLVDRYTFFTNYTPDDARLFLHTAYYYLYNVSDIRSVIAQGIIFFETEIKNAKLIDVQNLVADIKSLQ